MTDAAAGQRTGRGDRPRQVAFDVVRAVSQEDAYANLVLPGAITTARLSGRDAAFATELVYGTLRRQGSYDAIVRRCSDRPVERLDPGVPELLRLGAHQIFAMQVPVHAAVSTSVELAKRNRLHKAAGFVNAVLRRASAHTWDDWMDELCANLAPDSDQALGLRHAHPEWVVTELRAALQAHGRAVSELVPLLDADNEPAAVSLVARPGQSTVAELVASGAHAGRWSPWAATLPAGDPRQIPAVRERRAGVQDEGSQLVALALADVALDGNDEESWLDMCAGPGGKAALLGGLAEASGARLEAWELHPHRADLVRAQVPTSTVVRVCDAAAPEVVEPAAGAFDRVLLDAPCSGAGAFRRRPEARWRKHRDDLPALVAGQQRLLRAALTLVRPGGVVAYVTCSPLVEETIDVVNSMVSATSGESGRYVERLDASHHLQQGVPQSASGDDVQLWPHLHGTDAMYLSLLRRAD